MEPQVASLTTRRDLLITEISNLNTELETLKSDYKNRLESKIQLEIDIATESTELKSLREQKLIEESSVSNTLHEKRLLLSETQTRLSECTKNILESETRLSNTVSLLSSISVASEKIRESFEYTKNNLRDVANKANEIIPKIVTQVTDINSQVSQMLTKIRTSVKKSVDDEAESNKRLNAIKAREANLK